MKTMKIFLTGGTGVLGRRVLKLFVENDTEVVVLSRSAENEAQITNLGGIPFQGDLFRPADLVRGTKGCDAILHLATNIPRSSNPASWVLNDRIRTEGTRNLLAAAKTNGTKFFLQQSVALLYGDLQGQAVTPDTPIAGKQPLMLISAVEMERMVRESASDQLQYSILRFGNFYAPDSVQTQDWLENVRRSRLPVIGKGNFFWNMIHADDAASAVAHVLLNSDKFENKTLNVSDFNPVTFKNVVTAIAEATNSPLPQSIPHTKARLIMGADTYQMLTASFRITDQAAMHGWKPRYPSFRTGLQTLVPA